MKALVLNSQWSGLVSDPWVGGAVPTGPRGQAARAPARRSAGWVPCTVLACCLLAPSLLAEPLGGGGYSLNGGPVTGGGQSGGGTFAVAGAAGQTSVAVSKGGTFTVTGGLVGVTVVPGDVTLELTITDDGNAKLTWSGNATGYVLEFSPTVGEFANWQPVTPAPTGNTFTTPFNQPLRFFRLRKP